MVQTKLVVLAAALLAAASCAPSYSWQKYKMDGHRTGVTVPTAKNVAGALGTVEDGVYTAPNGRKFEGGAVYAAASDMIAVQTRMASLKEVICHSAAELSAHRPESELSNWLVDRLMEDTGNVTGRKVDVGIANFGGIRVDLPAGDVLKDDLVSMFPFKNYLCYVALEGRDLQVLFDQMARRRVEVLGGVRLVISDHKVDTLLIGGKPLDPDKIYGVATIDFLLDGGDSLSVAKNAKDLIITDKLIIDSVLPYAEKLEAEGKLFEYALDGRVKINRN